MLPNREAFFANLKYTTLRAEQIARAANHAYRDSRRRRRPIIHQRPLEVLETRNGRPVKGHSTTVIPVPVRPLTWKQARAIGEATGRILESLPTWPTAKEIELERRLQKRPSSARPKPPEKLLRGQKAHLSRIGNWWSNKLADLIERREAEAEAKAEKETP